MYVHMYVCIRSVIEMKVQSRVMYIYVDQLTFHDSLPSPYSFKGGET